MCKLMTKIKLSEISCSTEKSGNDVPAWSGPATRKVRPHVLVWVPGTKISDDFN